MRCPVVVGREAELAALAAAAGAAAAGRGSCVLVRGEAGVGKTRLVSEAAALARVQGHVALLGRATPTDGASPLRPLAEALLDGLRDRRPPADDDLRPYRPALGTLVPHWAEPDQHLPAIAPAPVVLAEAVLRVLRWLAAGRAAMLVLEDLHWADRESLAVLAYIADHVARFPVAVLLTLRSDEPATEAVAATFADASVLQLAPLAEPTVAEMAAACLGVPAAPSALVDALRRAGGLPLVVEDLVDLGGPGPMRYAQIVARRLDGLDRPARQLLNAAAMLGNEIDPDLAGTVAGLGAESRTEALEAACTSGLLTHVPPVGYAFRHALTREIVLDRVAPPARVALSRSAAEVLDGIPGREAVTGELWAQAGDPRRATRALRAAAAAARAAWATTTAEALLRRALGLAPPDLAGGVRLDLLELLALAGRVDELAILGTEALDDLAHDPDLSVAVHLLLARAALAAGSPRDAQGHLDAVSAMPGLAPQRMAQLRVVQAAAAMAGGTSDRLSATGHLAAQAVALADESGSPELTCEALELLAAASRARDLTEAAGVLRRALAVAEQGGLVLWRLRALNELGTVELLRDARADRLDRAFELALRIGALDTAASVAINLASVHAMTGAIDEAIHAAGQARRLAEPLGATQAVAAATTIEGVTHGFAGRRSQMERLLRRGAELSPDDADMAAFAWGAGRALAALLYEERADALAALDTAGRRADPIRVLDVATGPTLLLRAVHGDPVRAEVEAQIAVATAGARWPATWLGYAHAVALAVEGEPAAAEAAFAGAERAADRYPLFRAIARRLAAEAALHHPFGEPVLWLRDAEAEFVRRGLHRIASACRGLLAQAGAPATRRRGQDAAIAPALLRLGVTAREAEVLELIADRLSNKDIASRLFLSPRTVEKHVASLLLKTGAADRAALIRLARQA